MIQCILLKIMTAKSLKYPHLIINFSINFIISFSINYINNFLSNIIPGFVTSFIIRNLKTKFTTNLPTNFTTNFKAKINSITSSFMANTKSCKTLCISTTFPISKYKHNPSQTTLIFLPRLCTDINQLTN